MPKVLIYRHSLGKISEPWIVAASLRLHSWTPIFLCRECVDADLSSKHRVFSMNAAFSGRGDRFRHALSASPSFAIKALGTEHSEISLLHSHFAFDAVYGERVRRVLGIPHVVTLHGNDVTLSRRALLMGGKASWLRLLIEGRNLEKSVDLFLGVSDFICSKAACRFPSARIEKCYLGVDEQEFAFAPLPNTRVILHVGRLIEKKGTAVLLKAFSEVVKVTPKARLTIVGSGPLEKSLKQLARMLAIDPLVEFIPHASRAEISRLIKMSSVFCLPSIVASNGDTEGLPVSLLEAMSCGRPVVATRHAGIPEAVEDGTTGFLVQERDHEELTARLVRVLTEPELARKLGLAGRECVVRKFSLAVCTKRLESLYDKML